MTNWETIAQAKAPRPKPTPRKVRADVLAIMKAVQAHGLNSKQAKEARAR